MFSSTLIRVPSALLCLALLAPRGSADVHDVGGATPDFAQISDAVAAAVDGDTIRVHAGSYEIFQIDDKALVLVGTGTVVVDGAFRIHNLSAGKTVLISGITANGVGNESEGAIIHDNAGSVRLQDCLLTGDHGYNGAGPDAWLLHGSGWDGARILNCADVALTRCTLRAGNGTTSSDEDLEWLVGWGGHGLLALSSTVNLNDCTMEGGWGGSSFDTTSQSGGQGGNGLDGQLSTITATGCTGEAGFGGRGGDGDLFTGPGWGGDGGHGADVGTLLRHMDCTWIGGAGGPSGYGGNFPGSPGSMLSPWTTAWLIPGPARHFSAGASGTSASSHSFLFEGEVGDLAVLLVSGGPNHYFAGVGHGNLLIARGGLTRSIVGAIGASGQLGHSMVLPNIGAFATLTLHYQALFQSSTGGLYLGPPQLVNVLGSGF